MDKLLHEIKKLDATSEASRMLEVLRNVQSYSIILSEDILESAVRIETVVARDPQSALAEINKLQADRTMNAPVKGFSIYFTVAKFTSGVAAKNELRKKHSSPNLGEINYLSKDPILGLPQDRSYSAFSETLLLSQIEGRNKYREGPKQEAGAEDCFISIIKSKKQMRVKNSGLKLN